MNARAHENQSQAQAAPRLVLITAEPESQGAEPQPLRILGSEPRLQGQFRLTDR